MTAPRLLDRTHHRHDVDELTWVATGRTTLVIDGERWELGTDGALVIPAGVEHTVLPRHDSLVIPLLFPEGLAHDGSPRLVTRSPQLDRCVVVLLQQGLATPAAIAAARIAVRQLVRQRTAPCGPPLPRDDRAREIAEALIEHPDLDHTLEVWARRVHTSSKTVQRSFRRDTGMTFPQWRAATRLATAIPRLERGDGVASVARAVGYRSVSAFTDAFRRRYGVAPSRYAAKR